MPLHTIRRSLFAALLVFAGWWEFASWTGSAPRLASGVRLVPVALGHAVENLNSQSFSRQTLYSVGQTQYIAFYAANTEIVVGRRTLGTTNWEFQATGFHSNSDTDGHNVVSLGISGDGFLHLSWGMHWNPFH